MKKKDIQETLDSLKEVYPELKELILHNSDSRLGKKIALVLKGESGTINPKTDYLTYSEMHRFLQGYVMRADNRLNAPTPDKGLIQLQGVDGDDIALFEYDKNKMNNAQVVEKIESAMESNEDEDNPLDAAEETLMAAGVIRVYVDYARTAVI